MQINGIKFYDRKDGTVKIVKSSNDIKILTKKEADKYKMLLIAQNKAPVIFEKTLKKLGVKPEKAHLLTEDDVLRYEDGTVRTYYLAGARRTTHSPQWIIRKALEDAFYLADIDLSFMDAMDMKHNIRISGNPGGITTRYMDYLNSFWKPCKMSKEEITEHLKKKSVNLYMKTRDGIKKINKEDISKFNFGSDYKHTGIGSQASVIQYNTDLKMDQYGNLLIRESVLVYD